MTLMQRLRRVSCWAGFHRWGGAVTVWDDPLITIPPTKFTYGRRVQCCSWCGYPVQPAWRLRDLLARRP